MSLPIPIPEDLEHRLDPIDAPLPRERDGFEDLRPAAVLALLMPGEVPARDADPRLLLIERSAQLAAHPGQLAFPGGKSEPSDCSLVDTARRETEEEVGLPRAAARVLGRLGPVPTPTGFLVVPFVGWAPPGWMPIGSSPEVHRVLTPRVSRFSDPDVHRVTGRREWRGFEYEMHEYAIGDPPLWGATARMVWDLLQRCANP